MNAKTIFSGILFCTILISCGDIPEPVNQTIEVETIEDQEIKVDTVAPPPLVTFENTDTSLIVDSSTVIFLYPDSTEYREMEAKYSEEDLTEIVSGMNWYPFMVQEKLDSTEFKYQDCSLPLLVFNKSDGSSILLERKKLEGNMIIFNVDADPIVTYAVNFDEKTHLNFLRTGKL